MSDQYGVGDAVCPLSTRGGGARALRRARAVARRSRRGAGDREGAAAAGMLAALVEGARRLADEREQLQVPWFPLTEAGANCGVSD
jgi:hypothetical protein